MIEVFILIKTLFKVFRDWGKNHPIQLMLYAGITLAGTVLLVIATSEVFDTLSKTLPQESAPETTVIVPVFSTPTVEPTLEPEELPEIDVAFGATVELASCELDLCEVPVWQTHERTVLIGVVPERGTVDVISCFYPLTRQELSEDGETAGFEFNTYTVEGLWCETYYLDSEGDVIKGVIQYWNLLEIEAEGLEDVQITP